MSGRISLRYRARLAAATVAARVIGSRVCANVSLEQLVRAAFMDDTVGAAYGLGRREKRALLRRFERNKNAIPTATSWLYHAVVAAEILRTPPTVPGDVVECGCWLGGATANLSLACSLSGRTLIVFDSFAGLPEDEADAVHHYPHLGVYGFYRPGMYKARIDEVEANISRFGDRSVCELVPGLFSDTMPGLSRPVIHAMVDVDLLGSLRDCLRHLWPRLVEGGYVYCDDSCDMEVVRLWFDDSWWLETAGQRAPGYVGSGCGLPLSADPVSLGFARKVSQPAATYARVDWLHYPGGEGDR